MTDINAVAIQAIRTNHLNILERKLTTERDAYKKLCLERVIKHLKTGKNSW